jgi:hypothetical protein
MQICHYGRDILPSSAQHQRGGREAFQRTSRLSSRYLVNARGSTRSFDAITDPVLNLGFDPCDGARSEIYRSRKFIECNLCVNGGPRIAGPPFTWGRRRKQTGFSDVADISLSSRSPLSALVVRYKTCQLPKAETVNKPLHQLPIPFALHIPVSSESEAEGEATFLPDIGEQWVRRFAPHR